MSSGNSGYPAGPPGQIARGQLGLCAQGVEPGSCQEVRGGGQRSRARPSSWGGQWGDLVLGGGLGEAGCGLPGPGSWAAPGSGLRPGAQPPCPWLPQSRRRHCRHHAASQDCASLDSAPGRWLPGSEGSETLSAPVPHQRHPAQGQLRCSAGRVGGRWGWQEVAPLHRGQAWVPRPLTPSRGLSQFAGTWLLVAVASSCRFLQEQGHRAEATTMQVAPQGTAMAIDTFRKL